MRVRIAVLATIVLGALAFFQNCGKSVSFNTVNPSALQTGSSAPTSVCDPFHLSTSGTCQAGIRASLYYASASDVAQGDSYLSNKFADVSSLISNGVLSGSTIYLPYLDVRARVFTDGFTTNGNDLLTDDQGNKLFTWFALDMNSILKLGAADTEGYYQLLIMSDDGANVFVADDPTQPNSYRLLINNDGLHSTRVGCTQPNDGVAMTMASRIPIHIEYYQGPANQIAVSLFWRQVTSPQAPLSQYCGRSDGADGWGFGEPQDYQLILNEGWKPLSVDNFILPP